MRGTAKYFPDKLCIPTLIGALVLSDILSRWLAVPIARGLGWSLAIICLAPFARKYQITLRRVLFMSLAAGVMALIVTFILMRLGFEG